MPSRKWTTHKLKPSKKANDYNEALAKKDTQSLSVINYEALLTVTDAIGYVDIPKINIYLPIFHDMSDEVLQKGVGHMEGTSLPVGGKKHTCSFAGTHRLAICGAFHRP